MKKKGLIEMQASWIFILIAGAVIFAFFFTVIQKQQNLSELRLANTLVNQLDAVTTSASIAEGVVQTLDIPRRGIDFTCRECNCQFKISDRTENLRDKIMFAPGHIEGNEIVLWTQDWKMPFRASNFIFATNDRIKYFIVADSSSSIDDNLAKELPDEVNFEVIDPDDMGEVENENYLSAKFIFVNDFLPDLHSSFRSTEVSGILLGSNDVAFYTWSRGSWKQDGNAIPYADREGQTARLGAVFAANSEMFECNMLSATRRLASVAEVSMKRLILPDFEELAHLCVYTDAANTLGALKSAADSGFGISSAASQVEAENTKLIRASCPTIY